MSEKLSEGVSITEEIVITKGIEFYGDDMKQREEALRVSLKNWYEYSVSEREKLLSMAKELNKSKDKHPLPEEKRKVISKLKDGEKALKNLEAHGVMPIETIEIRVLEKKK